VHPASIITSRLNYSYARAHLQPSEDGARHVLGPIELVANAEQLSHLVPPRLRLGHLQRQCRGKISVTIAGCYACHPYISHNTPGVVDGLRCNGVREAIILHEWYIYTGLALRGFEAYLCYNMEVRLWRHIPRALFNRSRRCYSTSSRGGIFHAEPSLLRKRLSNRIHQSVKALLTASMPPAPELT
jgi:hypothetical protein